MKKFLVAIMLLLPLTAIAEDYALNVPQWRDFVPCAFVDVKEPKGLGKLNLTAKYWYDRRVSFERSVAECKALETYEEQYTCYEELKNKEFQENTNYNARIEARQNSMSGIPEMNSRTDTMFPVNNYLNTYTQFMPNELR